MSIHDRFNGPAGSTAERSRLWPVLLGLAAVAAFLVVAAVVGGELGQLATASLEAVPLAVLALLAYLGRRRASARVACILWFYCLVLAIGAIALGTSAMALGASTGGRGGPGDTARLGGIVLAMATANALGALFFIRRPRLWLARWLPIDPDSFVHTVGLVATVTLGIMGATPLIFLGEPPLLGSIGSLAEGNAAGADRAGALRNQLYGLVWMVPSAFVAVGWGVRRRLGDAARRLGLVWPTRRQVIGGLIAAVALVAAAGVLDSAIAGVWQAMGWPTTNGEAFEKLIGFAFTPIGAVVVGVTAGLGEELAVRGVLQPRLGILLSNLFFMSLHALQYNWDGLVAVFVVGLILGLIRRRTNTTTSAIVHGTYDFLLVMGTVLNLPTFR